MGDALPLGVDENGEDCVCCPDPEEEESSTELEVEPESESELSEYQIEYDCTNNPGLVWWSGLCEPYRGPESITLQPVPYDTELGESPQFLLMNFPDDFQRNISAEEGDVEPPVAIPEGFLLATLPVIEAYSE